MRRQQVGSKQEQEQDSLISGSFLGFALCCGVKVAEYLQRIVRLVILRSSWSYWASPNEANRGLVCRWFGSRFGWRFSDEVCASYLLHGSGAACLQFVEVYQV